jgi:hypothetical protein
MVGRSWVSLVFGLAACGGRYDVGSGPDGSGGSDVGSGGSPLGSGGSGSGGAASDGGTGASPLGSGGSAIGSGGTGTGGSASAAGGSAGTGATACTYYPELPPQGFAEPAVVWRRISRFLYGEEREPLAALPESTTLEWMSEQVEAVVRGSHAAGDAPAGLVRFVRGWGFANPAGTEARARQWTHDTMLFRISDFFFVPSAPDAGHSLLLEPSFLQSKPTISSRGAFIAKQFLCDGEPDIADSELLPAEPGETSRQTLVRSTQSPTCAGCHALIDPFGFALSHYDEAGNYREDENGLPIDTTGNSTLGEFDGLTEMSVLLATSEGVRECLAGQLLNFAMQEARGLELPPRHLPIETPYIVCHSAQQYDSFLAMIQAVVMVPSFSMAGPDM